MNITLVFEHLDVADVGPRKKNRSQPMFRGHFRFAPTTAIKQQTGEEQRDYGTRSRATRSRPATPKFKWQSHLNLLVISVQLEHGLGLYGISHVNWKENGLPYGLASRENGPPLRAISDISSGSV